VTLTVIAFASVSRGNEFEKRPFEAANIASAFLSELKVDGIRNASELDVICQQNDPKTMSQVHQNQESMRKPDVVIIPFSYDAFLDAVEKVDSRR